MEHGYPIRVVSKRTGMSPHLIRIWERRYGAVSPYRTETGRRFYTDKEIERLVLLRRATIEGQAISQIAHLTAEELRELIATDSNSGSDISTDVVSAASRHLELSLQSLINMDAVGLELELHRALVELGQQAMIERVLHPLLERTGEMWADGRLRVAHEHLGSAVVRSLLGSMYHPDSHNAAAPLLISTTPAGEHHEFGALVVSVTAAENGWRTLYLGSDMPAEDIAQVVKDRGADALALSLVYPEDDLRTRDELRKLRRLCGPSLAIFAGGRAVDRYRAVLDEINAVIVTDLNDLRSKLKK